LTRAPRLVAKGSGASNHEEDHKEEQGHEG